MRTLRNLNIGYTSNSIENDLIDAISTKIKNCYKCDNHEELFQLINNNNVNLIIIKDDTDFIKKVKKSDNKVQILSIGSDLKNYNPTNVKELEFIKILSDDIIEEDLIKSLKKCIKNLDSNQSNLINLENDLTFDSYNHILFTKHKIINLSKKESLFLDYILDNQNKVVTYDQINKSIWNGEMTNDALRSIVKELRKKTYKELIKNVSGVGYRINF